MSLRKAAASRGIDVKVSSGPPGQLQILKDGNKVFDYKETGSLPETGELLKLVTG